MESFFVDQATHTLRSTAILFLRDRGERNSVYAVFFYSPNIDYVMESNLEWGAQ